MPEQITPEEMEAISEQASQYAKLRALALSLKDTFDFPFTVKHKATPAKWVELSHREGYSGNTFDAVVSLSYSLEQGYLTIDPSPSDNPFVATPVKGCNKGKELKGLLIGYRNMVKLPLVVKMNKFFEDYKAGRMPPETLAALDLIKTGQV